MENDKIRKKLQAIFLRHGVIPVLNLAQNWIFINIIRFVTIFMGDLLEGTDVTYMISDFMLRKEDW